MKQVIAIAIVASNGVLGDGKKQPFEFAEDWARYKKVTLGHPMVMGRSTHEAIGRWLPGRTTIVVTHDPASVELPTTPGTDGRAVDSLRGALALAGSLDDVIYVAGAGPSTRRPGPTSPTSTSPRCTSRQSAASSSPR